MRLLQVSAFFAKHGGGIEVVADRIGRAMAAAGNEVCWFAGGLESERPDVLAPRLRIEQARSLDFVERRFGLPYPIWSMGSLRKLWAAVASSDVIHVHDYLYLPTMLAIFFAKIHKKPVVLTQHIGSIGFRSVLPRLILSGLNRSLGRICMRLSDQVVFVGQPVKCYFERFSRFRRPALLIPNGVDHDIYRPHVAHVPNNGPRRCLFVGRFVEKKGMLLIRECMDIPGMHWTFIGWGPMSPADWGLPPDRLDIHVNLRAQAVVPFYQSADLLVLPSTGEGFPLVVQESLACGTPVLVSGEVAAAFPVTDTNCVFAVDLQASDAGRRLRERLVSLLQSPGVLFAARESAVRLAAQWSWETCTERYQKIYRTLMN